MIRIAAWVTFVPGPSSKQVTPDTGIGILPSAEMDINGIIALLNDGMLNVKVSTVSEP